jgi:hypothetical protein
MKIIFIIPCVLSFLGVIDVADAAEKQLRGSNRELQFDFGSIINGDDPSSVLIASPYSTDPTKSSPTITFQLPGQPSETSGDNAPFSGNSPFEFPPDSGLLQQTDPAETPIFGGGDIFDFGGFGGEEKFDFASIFGRPSSSESFQTGTGGSPPPTDTPPADAPSGSGADDSPPNQFPGLPVGGVPGGVVCTAVFDPVICEDGERYSNSCDAGRNGFAANQCRPDSGADDSPPNQFPGLPVGGVPGGVACPAVFDPVICEDGERYSNSCDAGRNGFAANQCRPD